MYWCKQNITEGIISVNIGTNVGSSYECGVFWNKDGNTTEAFSYTFLEACNSIINLVVYQTIPCSYLESEGRKILTLRRTWGSPPSPFSCAWDTNYQRWLIIPSPIISQIDMRNFLTIKSPREAMSWSFRTFLKDNDININFK